MGVQRLQPPSQSFKVFASFHLFWLSIHLQIIFLVIKDPSRCFDFNFRLYPIFRALQSTPWCPDLGQLPNWTHSNSTIFQTTVGV